MRREERRERQRERKKERNGERERDRKLIMRKLIGVVEENDDKIVIHSLFLFFFIFILL